MFADDISLNTSDQNTDTAQKELQRSTNEASDWCDKNATILYPAKAKCMLLATRQKHQLRPLLFSLKNSHTEQFYEHRHLCVIIDDEFSWRPHITGTCKTAKKIFIRCHSSDTLWTHLSASSFTLLMFPLT